MTNENQSTITKATSWTRLRKGASYVDGVIARFRHCGCEF